MISKNLYLKLTIRVILIVLLALAASYCFVTSWYLLSLLSLLFLCIQAVVLIRFVNHTNRKIAYFFDAIKNEDFTLRYPEKLSVKSLQELNHSLNMLNTMIQEIHLQNKVQEQYYQEILRQADIGILTVNSKGHILFANPTVERLLNYAPLNHIKQLRQVDPKVYELFSNLKPFDQKLVQLTNEREKIQLAIKSSSIVLKKEELLLIVVQDIHKELDEKETDSWIRLIRVLTHEIMNTITPITSISGSVLKYFKTEDGALPSENLNEGHIRNTVKGLEVIKEQGANLMSFVQSYRSFLNVPAPDKTLVRAGKLLNTVRLLVEQEISDAGIQMETLADPQDLELFIDEKQISQVLLNLSKNAIDSLDSRENGLLVLKAGVNGDGKKFISITDNGPGIPPEQLEEIFVPFFTTKEKGTGIGLSLSKQIMNLHGGNLIAYSIPDEQTSFLLSF